jgi:hypothetical protein
MCHCHCDRKGGCVLQCICKAHLRPPCTSRKASRAPKVKAQSCYHCCMMHEPSAVPAYLIPTSSCRLLLVCVRILATATRSTIRLCMLSLRLTALHASQTHFFSAHVSPLEPARLHDACCWIISQSSMLSPDRHLTAPHAMSGTYQQTFWLHACTCNAVQTSMLARCHRYYLSQTSSSRYALQATLRTCCTPCPPW